ncbi:MAG: hypothetical protein IT285_12745 [Bdellovibrionales bacterium]|nr:hypothetical protein [Bdellovibrionales bacterium]
MKLSSWKTTAACIALVTAMHAQGAPAKKKKTAKPSSAPSAPAKTTPAKEPPKTAAAPSAAATTTIPPAEGADAPGTTAAAPNAEPRVAPPPSVEFTLIDAKGGLAPAGWKSAGGWVWRDAKKPDEAEPAEKKASGKKSGGDTIVRRAPSPTRRVALRVWALLPKDTKIVSVKSDDVEFDASPGDAPELGEGQVVAFETGSLQAQADLMIQSAGQAAVPVGMSVRLKQGTGAVLIDESCSGSGVELLLTRTPGAEPDFPYAGVSCQEGDAALAVFVHTPAGHSIDSPALGKSIGGGSGWSGFRIGKPKTGWDPAKPRLGSFKLGGGSGKSTSPSFVVQKSGDGGKRFAWYGNLGFTYLAYTESPGGVEVSELFLTMKVGADYWLVPRRWNVGGNLFVNMIPITKSPDSVETVRFYGLNGRVTYQIPLKGPKWTLGVAVGKYVWGMIVQDSAYGIKLLSGWQMFVQGGMNDSGGRRAFAYIKISPISESALGINFSNLEFAFGGGYRLSAPGTPRPLTLTLDVSTLSINEVANASNTASLFTTSLGVSMNF